jgi:hypothetical protein
MSRKLKGAGVVKEVLVVSLRRDVPVVAEARSADSRTVELHCSDCRFLLFGGGSVVVRVLEPTTLSSVNYMGFGECI